MIRIRSILILISFFHVVFVSINLQAQIITGARGIALGSASTAVYDYNWSIFSNAAMLRSEGIEFGFYGIRNYGFIELTDVSAFATISSTYGIIAVGVHRYGDDLFSESRYRIAYKNVWESIHAAIAFNYNHISFASPYGSGGALGIDIGIATQIQEQFWLGAKSSNINIPGYNFEAYNEDLPRDLSIGFSYLLAERALFAVDIVKDVRFPVSYRAGIETEVVSNLMARFGVTTEPVTYSFGLGYSKDFWGVNLVIQQHTILGSSPGFDMVFNF